MQRPETAVVVVLPPEPVVASSCSQRFGRLPRSLVPTRLAGPVRHRQRGEERPGRAPRDVVSGIRDVPADERVQIVRQPGVRLQPERREERPGLPAEQRPRSRVQLALREICLEVGVRTLQLDHARRGRGEVERRLGMPPPAQRVDRPGRGVSQPSQSYTGHSVSGSNAASASATIAAIASRARPSSHASSVSGSNCAASYSTTRRRKCDLFDVAPAPVLAGLGRADDRVAALVLVRRRVPVRR